MSSSSQFVAIRASVADPETVRYRPAPKRISGHLVGLGQSPALGERIARRLGRPPEVLPRRHELYVGKLRKRARKSVRCYFPNLLVGAELFDLFYGIHRK